MNIVSSFGDYFFTTDNSKAILFIVFIVTFSLWVKRCDFLKQNTEEGAELQLGFIRILTCCISLYLVARDNPLQTLALPIEWAYPKTFVHLLFGDTWVSLIRSDFYLDSLWSVALLSLACGALGLFTRVSLAIGALSSLLLYDLFSAFTHLFHTGLLPLQLLLTLTFLPCGSRLSIDSFRKAVHLPLAPTDTKYRHSLYLCWLVYAMAYLNAGLSKISAGMQWFIPNNLLGYTIADSLSLIQYDFNITPHLARIAPDWIFCMGALLAVAIESSAILLLINRAARVVIPFLIGGLHLFIFAIHEFPFFDLLILPFIFFPISVVVPKQFHEPPPPLVEAPITHQKRALWCTMLAGILISPQIHKVKVYPILDTWDMYSTPQIADHTSYYKIFRISSDGNKVRTDFQDTFSMFREAKWQDVLLADEAQGFNRLEKLLPSIITKHPDTCCIEIERWQWNFGSDRITTGEGTLEQSWTIKVQ